MPPPTTQLATRFSRVFTVEYAKRINAQIVSSAHAVTLKPHALHSALAKPLHLATFEPKVGSGFLPAAMAFELVKGRPFAEGNVGTAFFLATQYRKALGLPETDESVDEIGLRYMDAAAGYGFMEDLVYPGEGSSDGEGPIESDLRYNLVTGLRILLRH